MAAQTTALGFRYLCRYYEGTTTRAMLDAVHNLGFISDDDYVRALTGEPPVGYVPTPTAFAAEASAE